MINAPCFAFPTRACTSRWIELTCSLLGALCFNLKRSEETSRKVRRHRLDSENSPDDVLSWFWSHVVRWVCSSCCWGADVLKHHFLLRVGLRSWFEVTVVVVERRCFALSTLKLEPLHSVLYTTWWRYCISFRSQNQLSKMENMCGTTVGGGCYCDSAPCHRRETSQRHTRYFSKMDGSSSNK